MRRCRLPGAAGRPPSFSASPECGRDSFERREQSAQKRRDAGQRRGEASDPAVDADLVQTRAASAGAANERRRNQYATARPSTPPASGKQRRLDQRLRESGGRAPAPSAARTAISRWRETARVSIRVAMSAQAISSTTPTAAKSTKQRRTRPTVSSRSGVADALISAGQILERRGIDLRDAVAPHDRRASASACAARDTGLQPGDDAVVVHAAEARRSRRVKLIGT